MNTTCDDKEKAKKERRYVLLMDTATFGLVLTTILAIIGLVILVTPLSEKLGKFDEYVQLAITCLMALFVPSTLLMLVTSIFLAPDYQTPEFFIYVGTKVFLNKNILDELTEDDLAELTTAEKEFIQRYKKNEFKSSRVSTHIGPKISQPEMCQFVLRERISWEDLAS